jgi:hypothetical protein
MIKSKYIYHVELCLTMRDLPCGPTYSCHMQAQASNLKDWRSQRIIKKIYPSRGAVSDHEVSHRAPVVRGVMAPEEVPEAGVGGDGRGAVVEARLAGRQTFAGQAHCFCRHSSIH